MKRSEFTMVTFTLIALCALPADGASAADRERSGVLRAPQPREGLVRVYGIGDCRLVPYFEEAFQPFVRERFARLQVYAPWFDDETAWYGRGMEYKDLYAIYDCSLTSLEGSCAGQNREHQEMYDLAMEAEADPQLDDWILKDADGNPLYIPFGCEDGRCPQFAADVRNPAFRELWIAQAAEALSGGAYHGLFVDDVNLDARRSLSNGTCSLAGVSEACSWEMPFDEHEWASAVADFVTEIRAAFPGKEIVHNSVWFHAEPGDFPLQRQVDAADYINVERGVDDAGIRGGWLWDDNGVPRGLLNLLHFNDYVHARNRQVTHFLRVQGALGCEPLPLPVDDERARRLEYGLAGWLLISDGRDLVGADAHATPDTWWSGFDVNLGVALGDRYVGPSGVLRRDFARGVVLLNQPGAGRVMVPLGRTLWTLEGAPVAQVGLLPGSAKVLLRHRPMP
ncbi:MAG: putative glycoside hydrolase [Myxococcales bacterium]|nr:putative glycoside hydrolase [Myxococcales bacterium]